ncbi:uncharacterized protein N7484_008131 [Penicillium longicatenatum]|uniref:uncharacterized protein n=1 Tax=Penicillium longicatenatum TaxID=1561947 RepID=UPI0025495332|nr:uncharacterized protein N7484_008131 [Penicillium longicatenatum]KAJ5640269.1 hypothetical protein N7484_008131 [Penicillium longicatenatum]
MCSNRCKTYRPAPRGCGHAIAATYEIWNETLMSKIEILRENAPFAWAKHHQALRALKFWKFFEALYLPGIEMTDCLVQLSLRPKDSGINY